MATTKTRGQTQMRRLKTIPGALKRDGRAHCLRCEAVGGHSLRTRGLCVLAVWPVVVVVVSLRSTPAPRLGTQNADALTSRTVITSLALPRSTTHFFLLFHHVRRFESQ